MTIIFDHTQLIERIKQVFGTYKAFALAMGISQDALSRRLHNKTEMTPTEIIKAADLLSIHDDQVNVFFFTPAVEISTKKAKATT